MASNPECLGIVLRGLLAHIPCLLRLLQTLNETALHRSMAALLHAVLKTAVETYGGPDTELETDSIPPPPASAGSPPPPPPPPPPAPPGGASADAPSAGPSTPPATSRRRELSAALCLLLRVCLSLIHGVHDLQFTAMVTINKVIDACVVHQLAYLKVKASAALQHPCHDSSSRCVPWPAGQPAWAGPLAARAAASSEAAGARSQPRRRAAAASAGAAAGSGGGRRAAPGRQAAGLRVAAAGGRAPRADVLSSAHALSVQLCARSRVWCVVCRCGCCVCVCVLRAACGGCVSCASVLVCLPPVHSGWFIAQSPELVEGVAREGGREGGSNPSFGCIFDPVQAGDDATDETHLRKDSLRTEIAR
ncbi:Uncharacterized protein GBIM_02821 [Gryllus bimaculatus]|nr:Uncharacterized protein GBIM_02821 [Gryllus bimaculatus]